MVSVQCLDHHPNQQHLVTAGCDNGTISFLDLRQEKIPLSIVQGHSQEGKLHWLCIYKYYLLLQSWCSDLFTCVVWESRFHSTCPDNLITCSQDGSLFHWASLNHYKDRLSTTDNIWLSGSVAKGKVDITQLLPESNNLSVNSFDIEKDCVLAVTDREALYVLPKVDFH